MWDINTPFNGLKKWVSWTVISDKLYQGPWQAHRVTSNTQRWFLMFCSVISTQTQSLLPALHHCPKRAKAQLRVSATQVECGSRANPSPLDHTVSFRFAFVLLPKHFSNKFSQTVWILVAIKAFLFFPFSFLPYPFGKTHEHVACPVAWCAKTDKTNWTRQPWSDK